MSTKDALELNSILSVMMIYVTEQPSVVWNVYVVPVFVDPEMKKKPMGVHYCMMTELNQITENILEISECLVTKTRLQTDILFHSVMNQVSVSQRNIGYLCEYIWEEEEQSTDCRI